MTLLLSAIPALLLAHSMLDGGITSAREWQSERRAIPAYSICHIVGDIHAAQLREDISRYVSYRLDDGRAGWTQHEIVIHAREYVWADDSGTLALRGRCGNCMQTATPPARLRIIPTPHGEEIGWVPAVYLPPDLPPELQPTFPPLSMPLPPLPGIPVTPAPPIVTPPQISGGPVPIGPGPEFIPVGFRRRQEVGVEVGVGAVSIVSPEPATWLMLAGGLIALLTLRKRT